MRDAQDVLDYRLELFSKEEHPVLEAKAVWSWAKNEEEHPPSTGEIFAEYQATRSKILARLEGLPLADWWRTGQHGEFGEVSIKQQMSYFASHEITHLPQIDFLRNPLLEGKKMYAHPESLVSTQWVTEHLDDPLNSLLLHLDL